MNAEDFTKKWRKEQGITVEGYRLTDKLQAELMEAYKSDVDIPSEVDMMQKSVKLCENANEMLGFKMCYLWLKSKTK